MEIIDDSDLCIAKMKSDKYKEFIFKFFNVLETKHGFKSTLKMSSQDMMYKVLRLAVHIPEDYNDEATVAMLIIQSPNWYSPTKLNNPATATYHKLFNKLFTGRHDGLRLRFCYFYNHRWHVFCTQTWSSFDEAMVAVDLGNIQNVSCRCLNEENKR